MKKTTSATERAMNDNESLETRTECELDKRSKLSKGIEEAKNVAGTIVGCTIVVPFLVAAAMGAVGEIAGEIIAGGAAALYDSGKEGCKKIAQSCKLAYLWGANTSKYVIFKAEKEKWGEIEIDLGFPDIYRDYFAIIASNKSPDERKREYVIDSYRPKDGEFKLKRPGKKVVVVRDEGDLQQIIMVNIFYRMRNFVARAVKEGIHTNPDLPQIEQKIEHYENMLQKYLQ